MPRSWVFAVLTAALAGCGSTPEQNEILVSTTPPGAGCTLLRLGQPITAIGPTPAIALVAPDANPITVSCRRRGFADAVATVAPRRQPLFGFVTGANPDDADRVDITMVPAAR